MTDKEKLEIIAKDPILWMETFVSVPDKTSRVVKFKLTPEQKWLMKHKQKYNIVLKSRQLGNVLFFIFDTDKTKYNVLYDVIFKRQCVGNFR